MRLRRWHGFVLQARPQKHRTLYLELCIDFSRIQGKRVPSQSNSSNLVENQLFSAHNSSGSILLLRLMLPPHALSFLHDLRCVPQKRGDKNERVRAHQLQNQTRPGDIIAAIAPYHVSRSPR